MESRHCPKCDKTKPTSKFSRNRSRSTGYASHCLDCQHIYNRRYLLKKQYKIDDEEVDFIFSTFAKGCNICKKALSFGKANYAVDHNHNTGEIRGVLCNKCNLGLGHFKDDITLLEKAKNYLEKYA